MCIRFPELKLCMIHGADPWWDTAMRLVQKYANLRIMTSAWSPRRLPPRFVEFIAKRGKGRVIFATDSPVLSMQRCVGEVRERDLPEDAKAAWLHDAGAEFFFPSQER